MNAPQSRRFARFKSAKRSRQRLDCGGFSTAFLFELANQRFALQSNDMETNQAAEHLQVIRTLMERSALYRRALAPIMIFCGLVGIIAGISGWFLELDLTYNFIVFWTGAAAVALSGSFLLARRQALKDSEQFWSPPTRRITQALIPPLFIGCFLNLGLAYTADARFDSHIFLSVICWAWFYGCALCSAGFFVPRGIKLLGWIFIIAGCALFTYEINERLINDFSPNLMMGGLFGGLHLAYGIYLYFTEPRGNAS